MIFSNDLTIYCRHRSREHHNEQVETRRLIGRIENRTFDWLDLKMFESIGLVLPSEWFSLSGWPRFQ